MQTFHGESTKWRSFFFQFTQMARYCGWTSQERLETLIACMRDKAVHYLETRPHEVLHDYERLVHNLNQRYNDKASTRVSRYKLYSILQDNNEALDDYAERVITLAKDGHPGVPSGSVQSIAVDAFFRGCTDKLAAMIVMGSKPRTLDKALHRLKEAIEDQISLGEPSIVIQQESLHKLSAPKSIPVTNTDEHMANMITKAVQKALDVHNENHLTTSSTCTKPRKHCFACGFTGHFARECPRHLKSKSSVDKQKTIYCYHCGQSGHFARVCEQPSTDSQWSSSVPSKASSGHSSIAATWKNHGHSETSLLQPHSTEIGEAVHSLLKSTKEEGNSSYKKLAHDQAGDVSLRHLCATCSTRSINKTPGRLNSVSPRTHKHHYPVLHSYSDNPARNNRTDFHDD